MIKPVSTHLESHHMCVFTQLGFPSQQAEVVGGRWNKKEALGKMSIQAGKSFIVSVYDIELITGSHYSLINNVFKTFKMLERTTLIFNILTDLSSTLNSRVSTKNRSCGFWECCI